MERRKSRLLTSFSGIAWFCPRNIIDVGEAWEGGCFCVFFGGSSCFLYYGLFVGKGMAGSLRAIYFDNKFDFKDHLKDC